VTSTIAPVTLHVFSIMALLFKWVFKITDSGVFLTCENFWELTFENYCVYSAVTSTVAPVTLQLLSTMALLFMQGLQVCVCVCVWVWVWVWVNWAP